MRNVKRYSYTLYKIITLNVIILYIAKWLPSLSLSLSLVTFWLIVSLGSFWSIELISSDSRLSANFCDNHFAKCGEIYICIAIRI